MRLRIELASTPLSAPRKRGFSLSELNQRAQQWIAALCDAVPALRHLQYGVLQHEFQPNGNALKLVLWLAPSPQTRFQFSPQICTENEYLHKEAQHIIEKLREMQTCIDNEIERLKRDLDGSPSFKLSPLSRLMLQFQGEDVEIETEAGKVHLSLPPAPAPIVNPERGLQRIRATVDCAYEDHLRLINMRYVMHAHCAPLSTGRKLRIPDTPERKRFSLLGHVASLASRELEAEVHCLEHPLNKRLAGYQLSKILNETELVEAARKILGPTF